MSEAKAAARPLIELLEKIDAGNAWDRKYGNGLLTEYARAITKLDIDEAKRLVVEAVNAHDSLLVRNKRLTEALKEAIETIRIWHGISTPLKEEPEIWRLYNGSPEMKRLNAALAEDKEQTHERD